MKPSLIIKIYPDINKASEIINGANGNTIETFAQLDLFDAIRMVMDGRLKKDWEDKRLQQKRNIIQ